MENPFRIGERVTGEFFTDRADEVSRILRAMREPSRLLVYGPRRMGKSSAIEVAADRFVSAGGVLARADLGGATSVAEVADRLLTSFARGVERGFTDRVGEWVRALSLEMSTDSSGAPVLRLRLRNEGGHRLPGLAEVLAHFETLASEEEAPVCIVLDEFQRIAELGGDRAAWELRDLMQGHHHLSYVCAGSEERIIERLMNREGPFHGAFERLYIAAIPRAHFASWIEDRFRTAGVALEGVGHRVIERAGPRTEDVLKLARQVWFRARAQGRSAIDVVIEGAVDDIVTGDRGAYSRLWASVTPHQRNVLRAVAAGEEALTSEEVRGRHDLRSPPAVSQAVDAMERRGLVSSEDGRPVIDDPFFREWVVRGGDLGG